MESVKATFNLDLPTVRQLERTASKAGLSKSAVVREAIQEYGTRRERLSADERIETLRILDEHLAKPATRTQSENDAELAENREASLAWGAKEPDSEPAS